MGLYDTVRLLVNLPGEGLTVGAIGAVVHVFEQPQLAYEVEFADDDGRTIAQVALTPNQVQLVESSGF